MSKKSKKRKSLPIAKIDETLIGECVIGCEEEEVPTVEATEVTAETEVPAVEAEEEMSGKQKFDDLLAEFISEFYESGEEPDDMDKVLKDFTNFWISSMALLEESQKSEKLVQDIKIKMNELNSIIDDKEKEITEIREKLNYVAELNETLTSQNSAISAELHELRNNNQVLTSQNSALSAELNELRNNNMTLMSQNSTLTTELESRSEITLPTVEELRRNNKQHHQHSMVIPTTNISITKKKNVFGIGGKKSITIALNALKDI